MKKFFKRIGMKIKMMDGLTRAFMIAFILLALITSVVAFQLVNNLTKSMTILDLPGVPLLEGLLGGDEEGAGLDAQIVAATPEPWDGSSRVTVLILGLEYNDWRGGGDAHSDTMILLSIDPISKVVSMLSLPRDLWVNIPGFDYGRINEAYF